MHVEPPTLAWARYYLELGLRPFPLSPRSKVPPKNFPLKRYQSKDTPTAADLEKWFGDGRANVGLVTGLGRVVVDLDGPGAEEALAAAGVELPADAPRSATSNGFHVVLSVSCPVENRVKMLVSPEKRPGSDKPIWQVDVRGDGGYIVAPPSTHESGHVYEWERRPERHVPPAPAQLLELVARTGSGKSSHDSLGGQEAPKWVSEALRGVGEGSRDATCAKLAGYFLGKSIPPDIVCETLRTWGTRCRPPFPADQVDKTVASVQRRDTAAVAAASEAQAAEFQILGYNQGGYFYLPRGSRQVVELRAEQHTKLNLLRLAPLQYWEHEYAGKKGPEWDMAANALIRQCENAGVYDVARIRGRGAWWDEERAVLHVGDALVISGERRPLRVGRYIYEAAPPMTLDVDEPLTADEVNRVAQIAELISWKRPISAHFFAGWCAVAPICGALNWRPHVWMTGPAGSGKSYVLDKIMRPLLGEIGLAVQSETTEAGLRQTLGQDARPVTFDEIEGEDERAQMRVQNILALARQASSETGAVIIKGSALGTAKVYRIRSCFAFSSIGIGLDKHADSTRVTVLEIQPFPGTEAERREHYERLKALVGETITDSFVRRFLARSVRLIPVIRANAAVLATAGAAAIGSQRLGDQIGALLAGAYSLFQDGAITTSDAREWVNSLDWSEQRDLQESSDENRCLQRILEHVVRVQTHKGLLDRSVGELIRSTALLSNDAVQPNDAQEILWRMGIRVDREGSDQDFFTISNTHTAIEEILRGTPWVRGWGRVLRRVRGAAATVDSVRFGAVKGRGVEIPMETIQ